MHFGGRARGRFACRGRGPRRARPATGLVSPFVRRTLGTSCGAVMGLILLVAALWSSIATAAASLPAVLSRGRAWGVALPGLSYGPPVVAGDRIFVSVISPARHSPIAALALRASDGAYLWNYTLEGVCRYRWPGGRCGSLGGVALSADRRVVFIGADDFALHAIDAVSGNPLWNTTLGAHLAGKPALSIDGMLVYAATSRKPIGGSGSHRVFALDAATGRVEWARTSPDGGGFYAAPTVTADRTGFSRVFIGTTGAGAMLCLNGSSGDMIWEFAPPPIPKANASAHIPPNPLGCYNAGIYGTAAVLDGRVYFGAQDCSAWSLNATMGAFLWRARTVGVISISSPAVAAAQSVMDSDATAADSDGVVVFGSDTFNTYLPYSQDSPLSAAVYAIDARTGMQLWRRNVSGNGIDSSPALTATSVLIGSTTGRDQNGSLLELDRHTGALRSTFSTTSLSHAGLGNAITYDNSSQRAVFGGCDCMLYSVYVGDDASADASADGALGLALQAPPTRSKCGGCA
eukprot:COSAG02_NODE_1925_length_10344_cov_49.023231_5_plen_518_part_00